MAAGREDPRVDEYFVDDRPAVYRLLRLVVDAAADAPLSVCAEFAGRPDAVELLVRAGYRSLSVAPSLVAATKHELRRAACPRLM
jgi:phosphotransferase system enzyme I (PtsI)